MPRLLVLAGLLLPASALAQANHYSPPETVAFEDVSDGTSDADQNDLVIRTNKRCRVDASGVLLDQTIHLTALAAGASKTNALVLTFDVAPDTVTVDDGSGPQAIALSGARATLASDVRDLFAGAPTGFVNTASGQSIVDGVPRVVEATWSAGPTVGGTCEPPALSLERPAEGVVVDDASTLASGQPLLARFPTDWQVPTERTSVADAYPDFLTWLADYTTGTCTGDACAAWDWYLRPGTPVVDRPSLALTAPLPAQATCDDGVVNQDEAAQDCGGLVCPACSALSASPSTIDPGGPVAVTGTAAGPAPHTWSWSVSDPSWTLSGSGDTVTVEAPEPSGGSFTAPTSVTVTGTVTDANGDTVSSTTTLAVEALDSCKAYRDAGRLHATADGEYFVSLDGTLGSAFPVYCDQTFDSGGWTLVMRGHEAAADSTNWSYQTGDFNLPAAPAPSNAASWKYADGTINALITETYRSETDGWYGGMVRFHDAACTYDHDATVGRHGACYTCYTDEAKTSPAGSVTTPSGHWGLKCHDGVLLTSHTGDHVRWSNAPLGEGEVVESDDWGCDGVPGEHASYMAPTHDCNFTLWVR